MSLQDKSVLFLTSLNLDTNPRIFKEINLASQEFRKVTVICFSLKNWSDNNNKLIKKHLQNVQVIEVSATSRPFLKWVISSIMEKIFRKFAFLNHPFILAYGLSKRSIILNWTLNKIKGKYNLIVAHNSPAFFPGYIFSKKSKAPLIIDLEDFHPGESNGNTINKIVDNLQKIILPKATMVTAASPLILERVKKGINLRNTKVILNVFNSSEFNINKIKNFGKIKIVWFSQNISYNRGLEIFIPIIKNLQNFELTLIGKIDPRFYNQYLDGCENIKILEPVPQNELHFLLSKFDLGLAIEPGKDENNRLALSNKVFAYFQAGLYVVATSTPAQSQLLYDYPENGVLTNLNVSNINFIFKEIERDIEIIRNNFQHRLNKIEDLRWEVESRKLVDIWANVAL